MNYSYTILILLLPILIFLFIGLFGNKMKPGLSGMLGTSGLFIITLLSYVTAYRYFGHRAGESFQSIEAFQLVVAAIHRHAHHSYWNFTRSPFGDDAGSDHHRVADGAHL